MDDLLLLLIISQVDHKKLSVVQSESLVYQKRVVHVDCLINRLDHACTFWAVSRLLEPVEHFLWKFPLFLLFVFVDPSSDRWLITGEQDGAGDQLEVNKCRGLSILQICFQSCPTDRQFSFLLDWGTFRSVLWSDVRNIVKYYCEYCFFFIVFLFFCQYFHWILLVVNLHKRLFFVIVIQNLRGVGDDVFAFVDVVLFCRPEANFCRCSSPRLR